MRLQNPLPSVWDHGVGEAPVLLGLSVLPHALRQNGRGSGAKRDDGLELEPELDPSCLLPLTRWEEMMEKNFR